MFVCSYDLKNFKVTCLWAIVIKRNNRKVSYSNDRMIDSM